MPKTMKLSVSIAADDAKWARARARRARSSVSSVLTEALRALRQREARRAFLEKLAPEERASEHEALEIRRQWLGV